MNLKEFLKMAASLSAGGPFKSITARLSAAGSNYIRCPERRRFSAKVVNNSFTQHEQIHALQ